MCRQCVKMFMEETDKQAAQRPVPTPVNIEADIAVMMADLDDAPPSFREGTRKSLLEHSPLWWRDFACREEVIAAIYGESSNNLSPDDAMHANESFGDAIFYREAARGLRHLHVLVSPN